jgi:hypothetical protein
MQVCVFPKAKIDKCEGKIKTKSTKEKCLHNIHRVIIRRNTFLELGHSPDRSLVVSLDSIIGKSWDPISQQLQTVLAISSQTSCVLPIPHVVFPISGQGHLLRSSYQRQSWN